MVYNLKLIGYPIKHSLSPWIHERFLKRAGIEGNYSLFEIEPHTNFEEKIGQLKALKTIGFNVTVPYKQKIIPYLDELDETAKQMQAVNTVDVKNGKWYGYNTDGHGYLRSLKSHYPSFFEGKAQNTLIIGAGGAARAIYHALVNAGVAEIDIANRTFSKAEDIAAIGNGKTKTVIHTIEEAEKVLPTYDLIIQTTSVGMKPKQGEIVLPITNIKDNAIVSDIIYQPIKTKFLKAAEQANGNLHYGHTMLLFQAQYAFEIWFGKKVDMTGMDEELQEILEGR